MWEGWKCNEDSVSGKHYELMIVSHQEADKPNVLLTATINKTESVPLSWIVQILSFAPSASEYVLYEDRFMTVEDAEASAWEKAQEISHGFPAQ